MAVGVVVDSENDCQRIQPLINQVEKWAQKWLKVFNPYKYDGHI